MMTSLIKTIAALLLIAHGLIHLMATSVYMKLGAIPGFNYKTTLLSGRWDLGVNGIRFFGALWIFPAVGFVVIGTALLMSWSWWQSMLVPVTLFSLILTDVDWSNAFAGLIANIAILGLVWWSPRIPGWLS
jgi:hypothetical protein